MDAVQRRKAVIVWVGLNVVVVAVLAWLALTRVPRNGPVSGVSATPTAGPGLASSPGAAGLGAEGTATHVSAHNLMLSDGPNFRFYVRWLNGDMVRTRRNVTPSFDDPTSFDLNIKTGVLRANIGDIANFLNSSEFANSPLKNIGLSGNEDQLKLTGTVHKMVSLAIEVQATIKNLPDNRIQLHITKIDVLKVPFKALLGLLHVTVSDLVKTQISGVSVQGNDIFFDPQQFLPAPHIRGQLTQVHIVNPDLEEVYGNAQQDVSRVEQWRNFIRLSDGSIDFGKLTMNKVDLIMIDISKDPWFNLDLANYQSQLVNGYTRMTPQAGLQIFMPDLREVPKAAAQNVSIEWLKNRNVPPPADVLKH